MTLDPTRPEHHGIASDSIVALRIEGVLKEDPATEMYDVGIYHHDCADKARDLFAEINEEDRTVMAFELDWSQPVPCGVCEASLTSEWIRSFADSLTDTERLVK